MIGPRNVHPDELGEAEGMDVQDALRVGNRLVEAMDEVPMPAGQDFVDIVMIALADEPTPGTTGFLVPLRRDGILGGFRESFRQAWASVGAGRPMLGRSAALAYVLAVVVAGVSLTGAAALGTAGALGLFNATPTESPTAPPPPAPTGPPPSVAPSPSESAPKPTVGPTPSPTETDDETDDPNDDNSGPGGGGDDGSGDDGDSSGPGGNSGPGSSGSGADDSGPDDSGPGSDSSGPG
jgi:uncharacterized membrane protein YgcG